MGECWVYGLDLLYVKSAMLAVIWICKNKPDF